MKVDVKRVSISADAKINETMEFINNNSLGIALVVDKDNRLLGTVTDGDIRRALIKGFTLDTEISKIMKKNPILVPETISEESRKELMKINVIRHLPIIDSKGKLLYMQYDGENDIPDKGLTAFIMAGGEGIRLRPLTESVPKPMLKICEKPLLEIIISLLRNYGFKKIILNIRYLGHVIKDYFRDGKDFNVQISYVEEPKPLGTAGSLALINEAFLPKEPFIIMNADILTTLNFKVFYDFHNAADYDLTLCGRPYKVKIPFGYPQVDGDLVKDFQEKPEFTHLVNSGIYCISPDLIKYIPKNEYFDMPALIKKVCQEGKRVGVFPLREKFHEIGRIETYNEAREFYKKEMKEMLQK